MNKEFRIAKINTNTLIEQLKKLIAERDNLKKILEETEKKTNILKDSWESKTSESVFKNFEDMYKGLKGIIEDLNKDIKFLGESIDSYLEYEEKANKEIDTNIAA